MVRNFLRLKLHHPSTTQLVNRSVQGLLLISAVCFFVPFSPGMPKGSLDPSWMFSLNQAVAQNLSFGKELIFTYGPYASILTKTYHPSTDFLMMVGGFYLAFSYWLAIKLLTRGKGKTKWAILLFAIFATMIHLRDETLFSSYSLIVAVFCSRIIHDDDAEQMTNKYAIPFIFILFSTLGLLNLIKGGFLLLNIVIIGLCVLIFMKNKRLNIAATCLVSPIISMSLLWCLSGQSVTTLFDYLMSMVQITLGYPAMSKDGNLAEVLTFIFATFVLLWAIFSETKIRISLRLFLGAVFFLFLFISFKGAFVRHDVWHVLTYGGTILIAALILPFVPKLNRFRLITALFLSMVSWWFMNNQSIQLSGKYLVIGIYHTYFSAWEGLKNRISNKDWPQRDFDAAIETLREYIKFPLLQGTTDIYSCNQSYLIASGNLWAPRPIFQSYAVYTPVLSEINRAHLLSHRAPDNIIFRIEPIDDRIPSIEDGASWPVLLNNYQPTLFENNFLFLKKQNVHPDTQNISIISSTAHHFMELVPVPNTTTPIFIEIDIQLTFLGKLMNILFKPVQLQISLNLVNGINKKYRIIPGMSKSGLLISPLIENTSEFLLLYSKVDHLAGNYVKSFSIAPIDGKSRLWKTKYNIVFKELKLLYPI